MLKAKVMLKTDKLILIAFLFDTQHLRNGNISEICCPDMYFDI